MADRFATLDGFALRDEARRGLTGTDEAGFRAALTRRLDVLKTAGSEGNAEALAIKDAIEHAPFQGEPIYMMVRS
ncbi:MAG TPA: hypothetical protein VMU94_08495 [Streptosporangiaceae bacterium]|nr:hypothetical protein [Streptosporangiaceae bacterium]